MTQQQKEDALDKVKIYAFPMLLAVITYFLASINVKFEKMHETLLDVRIEQERLKHEIYYLRADTGRMQDDLNMIKKKTVE